MVLQTMTRVTELGTTNIACGIDSCFVVHNCHNLVLKGCIAESHLVGDQDLDVSPSRSHQILRREDSEMCSSLVDSAYTVQAVYSYHTLDVGGALEYRTVLVRLLKGASPIHNTNTHWRGEDGG